MDDFFDDLLSDGSETVEKEVSEPEKPQPDKPEEQQFNEPEEQQSDDETFFDDDDLLTVDTLTGDSDYGIEAFKMLWEEDGYQPDRQSQLSEYLFDETTPEAQRAKLFQLDTLLGRAIDLGASDVHLIPGDYVTYRILGQQKKMKQYGRLNNIDTEVLANRCISNRDQETLAVYKSVDVSYTIKVGKHKGKRTRLSVGKTFGSLFLVFRIISDTIPSFSDLNIPEELIEWSESNSGLILMNGPTGSGKTTTLASILQEIVSTRQVNVITLEKPVEYVFTPGAGTIVQRDVGNDTKEFSDGLTAAMRQDPDVIMVGEVRNRVEVDALIEATETGHLTFSTVHASNCSIALHRLSSLYAKEETQKILSALSVVSKGFVNQILVRSPDGSKRTAVRELLPFTQEVRELVEHGDSDGVYKWQFDKGLTMEHSLVKAVYNGDCTLREAQKKTVRRDMLDLLLGEK